MQNTMDSFFLTKRTSKERNLYGNNGIFASCCNLESLRTFMTITKSRSLLGCPIIQIGHWCSTLNPPLCSALFFNPFANMERDKFDIEVFKSNKACKYVIFTDLVNNSTMNLVEYASVDVSDYSWHRLCGWRSCFVYTDIIAIAQQTLDMYNLKWCAATPDIWYDASKYIFRLKPFANPACVVIHKSVSKLPEKYIEQFETGQSDCWTHGDIDVFVPACRGEEKRDPIKLSPEEIDFVIGNQKPVKLILKSKSTNLNHFLDQCEKFLI